MPPAHRAIVLAITAAAAALTAGVAFGAVTPPNPVSGVVQGTSGADRQQGTPAADTLVGGGGNDAQAGGAGGDTLNGGSGNDTQAGGPGADTITGGAGADALSGGPGPDVLAGGPGADTISCGPGADTVYADASDTLQGCSGDTILQAPANVRTSPMPVRLQWNANDGYCGETGFIAAGMTLGQYTSQWTARSLASPGALQTSSASQLMLTWPPGNWQVAAAAMRLNATGFDPTQYEDSSNAYADVFLSWVKNQFLQGSRVLIGMFNNVNVLGEQGSGDSMFDHIVPVMAIGSSHPLVANDAPGNPSTYDQAYYGDDQLTIGDNALYTPFGTGTNWGAGNTANNPQGSTLYTYGFDAVQKSRAQANRNPSSCSNDSCSPYLYSLYDNATNLGNYAVAISGVADDTPGGPVVAPISLSTSVNNEGQQNQAALSADPASQPMSVTATVTIPDPSKTYDVYLYTNFASVPTGSFNTAATDAATKANVARKWVIPAGSGATWKTTLANANTGGTYVFRAVPADAP